MILELMSFDLVSYHPPTPDLEPNDEAAVIAKLWLHACSLPVNLQQCKLKLHMCTLWLNIIV